MWPSFFVVFFFTQKTAYEISSRDWSSDVCSSDLGRGRRGVRHRGRLAGRDGLRSPEIGRASCRERVCELVYISVVAVSLKKKANSDVVTSEGVDIDLTGSDGEQGS